MTKPILAENRRYVLYMAVMYRNNKLKMNMAKTIRDKCTRLWKEQHQLQEVDSWAHEEVEAVKAKHAQQVASLEKRSCSRDSILELVPTNVEELLKYDLLLSVYIRFGNYGMKRGIPRAARASLITEEVTAIVEGRWLTFLQQKEALYKEIVPTNVQVYLELDERLKSGHIGNRMSEQIIESMGKQKKQVETAVKAYNEENAQFLRLPSSGNLQLFILQNILKGNSSGAEEVSVEMPQRGKY
ncbi:hypothetical protein G6F56_000858 [Rhizopus delemar]|nr:hypothetical protein G6F56_000858 [Rhizopus delemar]